MEFIDMKKCSQCGTDKHINEFRNSSRSKDGKKPNCKRCQSEKDLSYRNNNAERVSAARKKWLESNEGKMNECRIRWEENNLERKKLLAKQWRDRNIESARERGRKFYHANKEKYKETQKRWRKENPHIHCAMESKRRSAKLFATTKWADHALIKSIYAFSSFMSRATFGDGYHVDHIIPLQNGRVCGLHCEENLRVIRAEDNLKKHNKLLGEFA